MHHMTNTGWIKFSPLRRGGRSRQNFGEDDLCSTRKTNVNEEYMEAFRTKSFIDISNKAQRQLGKANSRRISSATPSLPFFIHLTDYLVEPRQETVTNITQRFNVHYLLVDYFQASLEACHYCDQILERIHQMRLSIDRITRVIKPRQTLLDDDANDQTQKEIYRELGLFSSQNNPMAIISPLQFREIHDRNAVLLHRLRLKKGRIRRRITFKRFCKNIGGIGLVVSHSALLISILILASHSIVGIVAAPSMVGGLIGFFRKKLKWTRRRLSTNSSERLCEQLDVAARGIYILINDFDTLSRMVKRIHDEVEHRKVIADLCIKNEKLEILKQVVKEFHEHQSSFLDQLEELEEHIYLCFLTINRSRRLVIQEIMEKQR